MKSSKYCQAVLFLMMSVVTSLRIPSDKKLDTEEATSKKGTIGIESPTMVSNQTQLVVDRKTAPGSVAPRALEEFRNPLQTVIDIPLTKQNFTLVGEAKKKEENEIAAVNKELKIWEDAEKKIKALSTDAARKLLPNKKIVDWQTEFQVKIIDGQTAQPGEWPWQALVLSGSSLCGGVLVHSCYVLTAKHCTNVDKSQITVTLGEHSRSSIDGTEQVRGVLKIIRHSSIDAALLLLDMSTDLQSSAVSTINLASSLPPTASPVTVTGWGWISTGVVSNTLQELELPLTDWNVCAAQLNPIFTSVGVSTLQSHEICAGDAVGNYANACHGDSGGPLAWFDGTQWHLVGIVARGAPGCPSSVDYAAYVSIPAIRTWILSHLPSTQGTAGQRCNCLNPAIQYNGAHVQASYDGANCYIGPAHPGCTPWKSPNEHQAFIYQNRYYKVSSQATYCPSGTFDSCNCYLMPVPASNDFIWNNNFYLHYDSATPPHCNVAGWDDSVNCYVASAPWATTAFKYGSSWYSTARRQCDDSNFSFDGANCYYRQMPSGSFIWNNGFYSHPGPGNSCPNGSIYDGANCYFRTAPWATSAFSWNGAWYHTPRRQCDGGQFDGANCLHMYPPAGATAFIWGGNLYYGWM